jgi:plasmid stabilization system protein ParE
MTVVEFHPEARAEAMHAAAYYEARQQGLGRRFIENLANTIERIRSYPQLFRVIEADLRKCRVPRFPYGVIYRHTQDRIDIIAVMHLRQRPGYWKPRIAPDDDVL